MANTQTLKELRAAAIATCEREGYNIAEACLRNEGGKYGSDTDSAAAASLVLPRTETDSMKAVWLLYRREVAASGYEPIGRFSSEVSEVL